MINLSDKVYNTLKWVTMVFLPAIATLYIALSDIWYLPYGQEVAGTIMAIVMFLGIFIQINTIQYKVKVLREQGILPTLTFHAKFTMTNAIYDNLKWIATIFLPAASTLYVAFSSIWNLPYSTEVSATVTAIVLFLGAILQISSLQYRASMRVITGESAYSPNPMPNASVFSMTNSTYDLLKFIAQGVLPGLATLYMMLAAIWRLPYSGEVSATIMAIVLFMNALLQVSTMKYNAAVRLVYGTGKHAAITRPVKKHPSQ